MSSYFDNAAGRVPFAEKNIGYTIKLRDEVTERVHGYIEFIESKALKSEQDKVKEIKEKFDNIISKPVRLSVLVEKLHDLGHDIGDAKIQMKGKKLASDNPYYPGHWK